MIKADEMEFCELKMMQVSSALSIVCLLAGKFLAGSFLSEENKIMIELKTAAEERARNRQKQHQQAPFAWMFAPLRLRW